MTYDSLQAQVRAYLDRYTDPALDAQIPNFVMQAQQRICRECKTIGLETYVRGTFVPTQPIYQKPALWRRTISFTVNDTSETTPVASLIQLRSKEWVQEYSPSGQQGVPKYYCDVGYSNFLLAPAPDAAYQYELSFLGLPPLLTDATQTNWLTDFAPDALLYATLLESAPYLKVDQRLSMWMQLYDRALQSLNQQDRDRVTDRISDRDSD